MVDYSFLFNDVMDTFIWILLNVFIMFVFVLIEARVIFPLLHWGIDEHQIIAEQKNQAFSIVYRSEIGSFMIAMGLVSLVIGIDANSIEELVVWQGFSGFLLIIVDLIIMKVLVPILQPYDETKELLEDNITVAWIYSMILIITKLIIGAIIIVHLIVV